MKSHFIKEWRLHRKMTQAQLAVAMGISRSYLTMIERGARRYDQNFLENAALVLDSTPADLIARPPGALQRIERLLSEVAEDDRARIENAIRALLGTSQSG